MFAWIVVAARANLQWMSQLSEAWKNKPLRNWLIPGTHNSASGCLPAQTCYLKTPFWLRPVGQRVCSAQHLDFLEQIKHGSRLFDVRAEYRRGTWYTHHGRCGFSQELIPWLRTGVAYIQENCPREVFFFHVRLAAGDAAARQRVTSDVYSAFAPLSPPDEVVVTDSVTYAELIASSNSARAIVMLPRLLANQRSSGMILDSAYFDGWDPSATSWPAVQRYVRDYSSPSDGTLVLKTLQAFIQQSAIVSSILGTEAKHNVKHALLALVAAASPDRAYNSITFNGFDSTVMSTIIKLNEE
jgi:hypothetical protein